MDKVRFPKDVKVYVSLSVLLVLLVLLMPRSSKFNYDYKKGSTWMYETLVAQFDFPVLKTEEQLQQDRERISSDISLYFRYSGTSVGESSASLAGKDFGRFEHCRQDIESIFGKIYSRGILGEVPSSFKDYITDEDVIYIRKDKKAVAVPVPEVYDATSAKEYLLASVTGICPGTDADSLCRGLGLYDALMPNLLFDRQTTESVHREEIAAISPTSGVVNAGRQIVAQGEVITATTEQLLDSYKAEFENNFGYDGPVALQWAGNILLACALVTILFLSIYYTNYRIFASFNKFLYLLFIFFLSAVMALIVEKSDPQLLYMMPFVLIALYLVAFFRKRVVLPVYIISLLPLLIFTHNGVELFVMHLVSGVVAIFLFSYLDKGWQQFVLAFIVFVIVLSTYCAFRFLDGAEGFNEYRSILFMFFGAVLLVAGYPLIYLFERIFMLVSSSRLVELCDTNNKLLLELAHKAPGTFQHCLQVMNLADAAARSIDANVPLVRAGALYHDVGKIMNPQCFIENETAGAKYHEGLSYIESAREIVKHVPDGVAMADKYNLPGIVKEFIYTHHGTTCTAYFYNKYMNEGGDPASKDEFFYKGQKPHSAEQVILMLCDTLEAASRTMKDYSQESVSRLVESVVKSKMDEGQFEEADITMRELTVIKKVMKDYIQQIHHARVVYPKRNDRNDKNDRNI